MRQIIILIMMQMKVRHFSVILSIFLGFTPAMQGALITSPNVPTAGLGTPGPFLVYRSEAPSIRYQELRAASDFSSLGSPLLITEFALWAPQPHVIPFDITVPNVAIHFSTSSRLPLQISEFFADNIGPDETTVFSGALHLVDVGGQYGVHIPLQTPFYYDPSRGNLLMDIWNYQTIPTPTGGGYSVYLADRPSTVALTTASDVLATRGAGASLGGMSMQFTVTPVPEPSTWALWAVGMLVLTVWHRKGILRRAKKSNTPA